jgi:hypothetical protein
MMITVEVKRPMLARAVSAIDHVWSGVEWNLQPHGLRGLAIEYDDGRYQSVHLCVDWGPHYLAMSIIRFRDSDGRITFFHSRPPPGIVRQTGIWDAEPVADGCCLRLVRTFELQCGKKESAESFHAREQAHAILLQDRMRSVLDRIAQDEC